MGRWAEGQDGISTLFWGKVSDSDDDIDELEVTWFVDEDELCAAAPPDEGGESFCAAELGADAKIVLQVTDPGSATGSDQVQITVVPTEAPTAQIIGPDRGTVYYSDQKLTFEGQLSDAEDALDALIATWSSDLDGELSVPAEPDADGHVAGSGYLSEGEHFITLTATDSTEKSGSDNVTITVGPPNSAPTCAITAPDMGTAGPEGELVIFEGETSDVDVSADWLSVKWASDKDGNIGESTPSSDGGIAFPYSDLSVNTHVVSMTVKDEMGAIGAAHDGPSNCTSDSGVTRCSEHPVRDEPNGLRQSTHGPVPFSGTGPAAAVSERP